MLNDERAELMANLWQYTVSPGGESRGELTPTNQSAALKNEEFLCATTGLDRVFWLFAPKEFEPSPFK